MKLTTRITMLMAVLAVLAVAGTAQADYHPACAGVVTGNDSMRMRVTAPEGDGDDAEPGFVSFEGQVTCPGAQRVDIDLALSGTATSSATASCVDVEDCLFLTSAGDVVDLVDGDYTLVMTFHVEGIGGVLVYDPPARCGVWTVAGSGSEDGPTITGPAACPSGE